MRQITLLLLILASRPLSAEPTLSLADFLNQVRERNQAYRAADENFKAAKLYQNEGRLILSPTLFSTLQHSDEGKPSFMPSFNYEKILSESYTLGLSQQTTFGLQGRFYYSLAQTEYKGTVPVYSEGRPALELTQSLWRNDWGREVSAQVAATTMTARATAYNEAFSRNQQLVMAELAYWRLALARQSRDLAEENFKRSERLNGWAERRVRFALADRTDLLQARAGLQTRRLEFKMAEDELRLAQLHFNSQRGVESEEVKESIQALNQEVIATLKIPAQMGERQDVLAAQAQSQALKAQAIINRERNQPILELYGTYAFNSKEPTKSDALSESWNDERPTKVVGLRFSSPLAWGTMSDVQEGYAKQAKAAELTYERRKFLQQQDWQDLIVRFQEAKERLIAAETLEQAQREKLDHERQRQSRGRSTLFQVLTFETDYLGAQGLRLKTLAELVQLASQMKLYGETYESR